MQESHHEDNMDQHTTNDQDKVTTDSNTRIECTPQGSTENSVEDMTVETQRTE